MTLFKQFLFLISVFSCTGKQIHNGDDINTPKDQTKKGSLHYYSALNKEGRINVIKGEAIVAESSIFYYAPPSGVQDGDHGTYLYIEINDDSVLKKNASFSINNDTLPITIAHWGSPAYYEIVGDSLLEGSFTVLEYKKYEYLEIRFDIKIKSPNQVQTFNDKITFRLDNPWHRIEDTITDWEDFNEEGFEKIKAENLSGHWEAYNLINKTLVEKNATIDTLLIVKSPYKLEIKGQKLQNHLLAKLTDFKLKGNQLILKDENSTIGFINQLDSETLQITWKNKYYYQRLIYKSVKS